MTEIATNCEGLWCISLISLRYRFLKKAYLSGCLNNRKRLSVRECASVRERVCVGCHACVGVEESVWARASADMLASVGMEECVCESSRVCVCKREREWESKQKEAQKCLNRWEQKFEDVSVLSEAAAFWRRTKQGKKAEQQNFVKIRKKQEKQKEQQQWD